MGVKKLQTDEIVFIDSLEKLNYYRLNYTVKKTKIKFYCANCRNEVITLLHYRKSFPLYCEACQREHTCLSRYGVINGGGSKESIIKIKATKLERYGDENYNNIEKQSETVKNKTPEEKQEIIDKILDVKLQKYGPKRCSEEGLKHIAEIQHENRVERCQKQKLTKLIKYGSETYNNIQKAFDTKEKRYGNRNYQNIEKIKETNNLKYGCDFYVLADDFKEKSEKTSLKNWGTVNPMKSDIIKARIKETNLEKYGTEYTASTEWQKEKTRQTCLKKYGTTYPVSHFSRVRSWLEDEICLFIDSLLVNYQKNNRILLHGKEIDLYFPDLNKSIEIQGTYWHADPRIYDKTYYNKAKNMTAEEIWNYDLNKKMLIESLNIEVMYIWEEDWINSQETTKTKIKEYLNG